jgi:multidrug efflux pump subunit AcrB
MSIGVATANSLLLVTFANEQRQEGYDVIGVALSAGCTRLRPVLMTPFGSVLKVSCRNGSLA